MARTIQLWLGPDEPSQFLWTCRASVYSCHFEWEHHYYRLRNNYAVRDLLSGAADSLGLDLFSFYLRMGEFASSERYSKENTPATLQSDLLRMALIYELGGIYLDMDVYALQPLDKFLHHDLFFGCISDKTVGEFLIAAEPQHPIIADIIRAYVSQPFVNREGLLNLTRWVMEQNLTAYPTEYFCPHYKWDDDLYRHTENTHLVHCWRGKLYDVDRLENIGVNLREVIRIQSRKRIRHRLCR